MPAPAGERECGLHCYILLLVLNSEGAAHPKCQRALVQGPGYGLRHWCRERRLYAAACDCAWLIVAGAPLRVQLTRNATDYFLEGVLLIVSLRALLLVLPLLLVVSLALIVSLQGLLLVVPADDPLGADGCLCLLLPGPEGQPAGTFSIFLHNLFYVIVGPAQAANAAVAAA
jgi:hypothetical protein